MGLVLSSIADSRISDEETKAVKQASKINVVVDIFMMSAL
jgi:hypothetical protein